jgi:NitT/TauT family transport system permease protein
MSARDVLYPFLGILVIAAIWEGAIALFQIPSYVLPHLSAIAGAIQSDLTALMRALRATLYVASIGYVAGTVVAVVLATLFVLVPALGRSFIPIIVAINSVPVVAYVPLALVWLGMGPASKIAMVILAAGFTVFVNTFEGMRSIDRSAVNLLQSFGAGPLRIAWILRFPAAMPAIVSGLRVAVVRSMIIAIVAEMLGAYEGIGRIIFESTQQVNFLRVWAAVTVASIASMAWYGAIVMIDRRLVWWK